MLLEELVGIQEISRILRNPKFQHRYYNSNSSVPILNQTTQLHAQVESVLRYKRNHESLIRMNMKWEIKTRILKSLPLALIIIVKM